MDQHEVFLAAAARGAKYLKTIPSRRVAPPPDAVAALARLGGALPDQGEPPEKVVQLLDEVGSPGTVANSGGRYFGFVTGAALPAARAANVLAAAWDQNAGLRIMSPTAAVVEEVALGWMINLFGLPASTGGAFVTGATMANFTCIASARHALLARAGWDVEADGLFGAPPITVVVGEEVHVSALKALALNGLGHKRVIRVPTDSLGRMRADLLPPLDSRTIVCTQAGNVNTGSFDPFDALCDAAGKSGAWVHVDGAFGLWAAASPEFRGLAPAMNRADSWATDAHKWLNVPYDCGLAFVRNEADLLGAMNMQPAAYLHRQAGREPMLWTPEASRRARGVEVWAALRQLGRQGLAELVARCCRHARRFAEGLKAAGYTVLNDVVLNQVLVAFDSDGHTHAVIEGLQKDGTCWCGGTTWKGRAAMRISVSSWATTENDVEASLNAMVKIAKSVTAR
jgi:glutamate/tyrosine decarboxylase-like PLP-dependent enzyme